MLSWDYVPYITYENVTGTSHKRGAVVSTISTTSGQLKGATIAVGDTKVEAFLGVPYAQHPTGSLRFAPPQPIEWDGEWDATEWGPTVNQEQYAKEMLAIVDNPLRELRHGNDSSLNLNIFSPDTAGSAPVLVYIHGGSFRQGSNSVGQWSGDRFARDGVVTVTINYRLGVEGSFSTEETSNNGLRDQIAALQWVQDNIASFGGDPNQVTVAGESAGAMSVGLLLTSPAAKGLFHQAILSSGAAGNSLSLDAGKAVTARFLEFLGRGTDPDAIAEATDEEIIEAAKQTQAYAQTPEAADELHDAYLSSMVWQPTVDGDIIPTKPIKALREGHGHDVPVLIATNEDEGSLFIVASGLAAQMNDELMGPVLAALTGRPEIAAEIAEAARRNEDQPLGKVAEHAYDDWKFQVPLAEFIAARHTGNTQPTWRYQFTWDTPIFEGALGALHTLDLPFVFDTLDDEGAQRLAGKDAPQALADALHGAWVSFVKEGDPGWEPTKDAPGPTAIFNAGGRDIADSVGSDVRARYAKFRN